MIVLNAHNSPATPHSNPASLPLIALAVIVVVYSILTARLKRSGPFAKPWPLEAKRQLLSERERALYQGLVQALPNQVVLAQVQLLQVLNLKRGTRTQAIANRFEQLSLDFQIVNPDTSIVAIKDIHPHRGVPHLRAQGKGNKARYIPLHAGTQELLNDYLDQARHATDTEGALFRSVSNNRSGRTRQYNYARRRLQTSASLLTGPWPQDRRAGAVRNGRQQRFRSRGGYRKCPGMVGTRQDSHHAHLRSAQNEARRLGDI
jgi:hypothetical protein